MWSLILLAFTSSLVVILSYKIIRLQKEYKRLLQDTKEDEKVLFLQSRYASMGETVGNIAHQWKQPLNAISVIQNSIKASLIFQGEISKEKLLNSVETSFKLLQHLAETIDTFYSFLAQRGDGKKSFTVADELEKIRKITEYSFENSNISLNFELEVNPTIQGNANEFTHAILNLILNAKDAFDTSSIPHPTITVQVKESQNHCNIIIYDNAGGIRITPVEMVFDMHITTKESGSGLGLFMSKKIIEQRFGGSISVENKNSGAWFTIKVPYSEYGEYFGVISQSKEYLSLERINQLSRKVIELEEAEKNLQKWAHIFEHAHWGIAMHVGTSNSFELTNTAFKTLYGYTTVELKNISVPDLFTPEGVTALQEAQKEAFEQGYVRFESVHKRKNGSTFPASIELIIVKDDDGEVLYHIANVWDLSEKKAAERDILLINKALNNSTEATYIMIKNRFIQVNDGACKMLGYTHQEFATMTLYDIDPDATEENIQDTSTNLKKYAVHRLERRHRTKDGRILDVEIVASFFEHDGLTYVFAASRDITEQKKAREELLLKEFALNTIKEAVYLIDEDSMFHYVNECACTALGYSKEELLSMGVVDIDPNISIELWREHWGDIQRLKTTLSSTQHKRKDGSLYPIEVSSNYFEYNGVEYSLAIGRDITERKLLEEQKDNERMKLFFERQLVGMAIVSSDKKWLQTNKKLQEMLGYTHEELEGHTCVELTHPDDIVADLELFGQLINGNIEDYMFEKRFFRKNGTIVYTNLAVSCVRNEDRSVNYVLVLLEDITERKQFEEKLQEHKVQLASIISTIPDLIWVKNTEGAYLICNPALERFFGMPTSEIIGKTDYDFMNTEAADNCKQSDLDAISSGAITLSYEPFVYPQSIINGILEIRKISIFMPNGKFMGVLGIGRDITERKVMEEKIANSYIFLNQLIDSIPDPIFVKDKQHVWVLLNQAFCELIGQSRESLIGKSDYDFFSKEEADVFWEKDEEVFSSNETNINEEPFTDVNGNLHIIQTVKSKFVFHNGESYLVGTIRDTTTSLT